MTDAELAEEAIGAGAGPIRPSDSVLLAARSRRPRLPKKRGSGVKSGASFKRSWRSS